MFVGRDEQLPAKQSGMHLTTLSNFKLKVLMAVPKP